MKFEEMKEEELKETLELVKRVFDEYKSACKCIKAIKK